MVQLVESGKDPVVVEMVGDIAGTLGFVSGVPYIPMIHYKNVEGTNTAYFPKGPCSYIAYTWAPKWVRGKILGAISFYYIPARTLGVYDPGQNAQLTCSGPYFCSFQKNYISCLL